MDMGRVIRELEAPAPLDVPVELEDRPEHEIVPARPQPVTAAEENPVTVLVAAG